jgi:hypothetical protein
MNRSPGLLVSHTVDTPVPLGGVAGPVLLAIENLDATNSVNVLTGLAGTVIATVPLGQFAVIPLPATITTPYLRALVADVRVDAMVA